MVSLSLTNSYLKLDRNRAKRFFAHAVFLEAFHLIITVRVRVRVRKDSLVAKLCQGQTSLVLRQSEALCI